MPEISVDTYVSLALILSGLALLVSVVMWRYSRSLNKRLSKSLELMRGLHNLLEAQQLELKQLSSQVHELNNNAPQREMKKALASVQASADAAALAWQSPFNELQTKVQSLDARLDESLQQDPSAKMYNKANKLVAQGASVEDIMQACELPRAEVEILMGFHRKT